MKATPAPAARSGSQLALVAARTRLALLIGGVAGLAAGLYTALYLDLTAVPTPVPAGPAARAGLVALFVPLAIAVSGLAALLSFRYAPAQDGSPGERAAGRALRRLNRLICAGVTGAACGWATWLLFLMLTPVLPGAAVSRATLVWAAGLSAGLLAAVIAYASAASSHRGLLVRLGLLIGLGLLLAMLLAQDLHWWRDSLSYMGRDGLAAWVFSITMILAGLGLCGVFLEMGAGLRRLVALGRFPTRSATSLTVLLLAASLGVIAIGVFPSNDDPVSLALHKGLGNGGLVVFVGVMFALRWLAPPFGSTAHLASAVIGVFNICAFVLYKVNVLNFVWFELLNIALLMAWLLLFEAYYRSLLCDCA
jgi:hypothetical protein